MGINISNGNMYSWVTHTWNTIKGKCPHDCNYCYMHRWGKQNDIRLDRSEFKTDLGEGNTIFIGSSNDVFASGIPDGWIYDTMSHAREFNNQYLFQSKNPERMFRYSGLMRDLDRVCTTIETNRNDVLSISLAPTPVWMDIDVTNVLQYTTARDSTDEKHICPLQLDVIERIILLYSNEGETVLSPFGGIGSEGFQALKMNRKSISIELKKSYFDINCKNHRNAIEQRKQATLMFLQEEELIESK